MGNFTTSLKEKEHMQDKKKLKKEITAMVNQIEDGAFLRRIFLILVVFTETDH